jgi:hypothetical protein
MFFDKNLPILSLTDFLLRNWPESPQCCKLFIQLVTVERHFQFFETSYELVKCHLFVQAQTTGSSKWAVFEIKPFFQIAQRTLVNFDCSQNFFLGYRKLFEHLSCFKTVKFIFYAVLFKAFLHGKHSIINSASSCLMG